ncbi:MAG: HAD hydrolase family protein [Chitinophagales bacterium]|nr:HAD hydrolase family protein [Bacteroidota bacterium]
MSNSHFLQKLHAIRAFVFDVDGVFTNNQLLATESGELLRSFNAKDGFAVKVAIERGYQVCIITGGNASSVYKRLSLLGIQHVYSKVENKLEVLQKFLKESNLQAEQALFMGDDIPDYKAMQYCGIACCPNDAVPEIQKISAYIANNKGGKACVREVIEMVLKVQDKWFKF